MSAHGDFSPEFRLPFLHAIEQWLEGTNETAGFIIPGWFLIILFSLSIIVMYVFAPTQSIYNFDFLLFFSPIWVPIVLARWAFYQFILWRRMVWVHNQTHVLLEIKIPRTLVKTPLAMEAVLATITIAAGEGTWLKRYVFARTRAWNSFEIVSIGGQVHLYVWCRTTYRRLVESAFYSQYPEIEIIEAIDYSRLRDPSDGKHGIFACEYIFRKPSPFPIKTYVDYGLERSTLRHERQVDPLASIIELYGMMEPEEQCWTQFIVRTTKRERYNRKKNSSGQLYTYDDEVKTVVSSLRSDKLTPGQTEVLTAIERNAAKLQFDVGIRTIYSAPPEKFHRMAGAYTVSLFRPFNTSAYNEIVPAPLWSEKFNDYPWEDIGGHRQKHEMHEVVEMYRRRSFFHPPYRGIWNTMSSEELATLFHIPNSIVRTPGIQHIESKTVTAPTNLPI